MFARLGRMYRAQFQHRAPSAIAGGAARRTVPSMFASAIALSSPSGGPGGGGREGGNVLVAVRCWACSRSSFARSLMALALPIGLIAVAIVGLLLRIVLFLIVLPWTGFEVDGFLPLALSRSSMGRC